MSGGRTCLVGDEHPRPAVDEQAGQLLLRTPRVQGHADAARAGDGEQALDRLDTVAEQHGHPVTARHTEPDQVTGQPCGPLFRLPVGQAPEPVLETDLVPEATSVIPEQLRQRLEDIGVRDHRVAPLR